ncbi:phospholipase C type enzyme [Tulasnella sp. 419]|nr:phospholipase C type enzyme [Tulasnella sp. 418]KAG8959002.1 phospholipase C type enzyme [Tulasnella sp. 419]
MTTDIRVLSFNCWGLKHVSYKRAERLAAIASQLGAVSHEYDFIGLQELWVNSDYQLVQRSVQKNLPYSKYFFSGALGSGLALFSKYPIISTSIRPYSLNGSPLDVAGGDFFVGKSITSIVVDHPILKHIEVFNTHMYARGGDEDGSEWSRAHRLVGAWQFANAVRNSAKMGRYVIATGDFNSIPSSLPMTIIRTHGSLTDAWVSSHDSSLFETNSVHNAQHAIRDFGITADSPLNSFSAKKGLDSIARRWQGKRLDYVLFRKPEEPAAPPSTSSPSASPSRASSSKHHHSSSQYPDLFCTSSQVTFTSLVPGTTYSYSDHFALSVTLQIRSPRSTSPPPLLPPINSTSSTSTSDSKSMIPLTDFPAKGISKQSLQATLDALSVAYVHAKRRSNIQLVTFIACLVGALGLIVGSAWQDWTAWNPLLVLVAVALGWGGTTMLYAG